MKGQKLKIVAFICTVVVTIIATLPLFERNGAAQVLVAIFGAVGVGATLANLIRDRSN
jgi:hypothetical protein